MFLYAYVLFFLAIVINERHGKKTDCLPNSKHSVLAQSCDHGSVVPVFPLFCVCYFFIIFFVCMSLKFSVCFLCFHHLPISIYRMRGSREFCKRGSNSGNIFFFFFFNSTKNSAHQCQIALKAGHHRPASKTPFKWHFSGRLMMAQH